MGILFVSEDITGFLFGPGIWASEPWGRRNITKLSKLWCRHLMCHWENREIVVLLVSPDYMCTYIYIYTHDFHVSYVRCWTQLGWPMAFQIFSAVIWLVGVLSGRHGVVCRRLQETLGSGEEICCSANAMMPWLAPPVDSPLETGWWLQRLFIFQNIGMVGQNGCLGCHRWP